MKKYKIWALVNRKSECLVQLYDPDADKYYMTPAIFKTRKAAREYLKTVSVGINALSWSKVEIMRVAIRGIK